jgi:hypothetical protein
MREMKQKTWNGAIALICLAEMASFLRAPAAVWVVLGIVALSWAVEVTIRVALDICLRPPGSSQWGRNP